MFYPRSETASKRPLIKVCIPAIAQATQERKDLARRTISEDVVSFEANVSAIALHELAHYVVYAKRRRNIIKYTIQSCTEDILPSLAGYYISKRRYDEEQQVEQYTKGIFEKMPQLRQLVQLS